MQISKMGIKFKNLKVKINNINYNNYRIKKLYNKYHNSKIKLNNSNKKFKNKNKD